jgi:hypothetical protein
LERFDLADSVRNGRKYGLLRLSLTNPNRRDLFNGACRALGAHPLSKHSTLEEIKDSGLELYKDDERLVRLIGSAAMRPVAFQLGAGGDEAISSA